MHSPTNHTTPNAALPPFDPAEFEVEQFLHGAEGDIKSLLWCVKKAMLVHHGIECWEDRFLYGDYSTDPADLWAWTIVDLHAPGDKLNSFVVTAVKKNGVRLYSFETDAGIREDVQLAGNEAKIIAFLLLSVFDQLG